VAACTQPHASSPPAPLTSAHSQAVALGWYAAQCVFNFAWSPLFFQSHRLDLALADSVALLGSAVGTTVAFNRVNPQAAAIFAPVVAWVGFATALNAWLLDNNPNADKLDNAPVPGVTGSSTTGMHHVGGTNAVVRGHTTADIPGQSRVQVSLRGAEWSWVGRALVSAWLRLADSFSLCRPPSPRTPWPPRWAWRPARARSWSSRILCGCVLRAAPVK